VTNRRKVIVHIAASADGYIARPDGDLEWLRITRIILGTVVVVIGLCWWSH
jgi:hypothetical protein